MALMSLMGFGLAGLRADVAGFGSCVRCEALNDASSASTTSSILRMSLTASFPMHLFSKGGVGLD